MLTYELKKAPGVPLYEALYRCIRADILSGKLSPGQKLPSKRALAQNLEVSKITVEAAYNQLLSEGYLCSREKVGYFVEAVAQRHIASPAKAAPEAVSRPLYEEFVSEVERLLGRSVATGSFGADMQIELINDGPVTIWIDSKSRE